MSEITVGIICATRFCEASGKEFSAYIDYIDRDEATKKDNIDKFNLFADYLDYVGDTEKMGSLFTQENDALSPEGKKNLKNVFKLAQKNGSNLWQTVISFDNRYLEKQGLYVAAEQRLNEKPLRTAARKAISSMLQKEGLENAIWAASMHYNTDNIHIHVAVVEPEPMRPKERYRQYKMTPEGKYVKVKNAATGRLEKVPVLDTNGKYVYKEGYRGKFKESSLHGKDGLRSILRAELENNREETMEITGLLRGIIAGKKEVNLLNEPDFAEKMSALYGKLKLKSYGRKGYRNLWAYGSGFVRELRPLIDDLSDLYVAKYRKNDFKDFMALSREKQASYDESYGGESDYLNKLLKKEFYPRLGNAILKELKSYDRLRREKSGYVHKADIMIKSGKAPEALRLLKEQSELGNDMAQCRLGLLYYKGEVLLKDNAAACKYFERAAVNGNAFAARMLCNIDASSRIGGLGSLKHTRFAQNQDFRDALYHLRKSLYKECEDFLAGLEFEKLQREIESRGDIDMY